MVGHKLLQSYVTVDRSGLFFSKCKPDIGPALGNAVHGEKGKNWNEMQFLPWHKTIMMWNPFFPFVAI